MVGIKKIIYSNIGNVPLYVNIFINKIFPSAGLGEGLALLNDGDPEENQRLMEKGKYVFFIPPDIGETISIEGARFTMG